MKKITILRSSLLVAAMFTAIILTGCKEQMDPVNPNEQSETEFKFTADIDQVRAAQTLASGIRDNAFKPTDEIGVFVVAYRSPGVPGKFDSLGNYVHNAMYVNQSSGWETASAIYYPAANVNVDIYAYWPYSANFFAQTLVPNACKRTVTADQGSESKIGVNDFMTAQVVNQPSVKTAIALKFYHRLSKVDVKFTLPSTFKGKMISGLNSIKLKGFRSGAIIDMDSRYTYDVNGTNTGTGSYPKPAVVDANSPVIEIIPNAVVSASPTVAAQYEAIVVPQTQLANFDFIELVVNYQSGGTEKFYYKAATATQFKATHSTVVNLNFQADNTILLGTVDIQGWEVLPDVSGDVVEKEVFNNFSLSLVDAVAEQVTTVEMKIEQGSGATPTQTVYPLPATNAAGMLEMSFAFDGTRNSPSFYPYTIKEVVCKDANGNVLATLNCNKKVVTAIGAVALVGTNVIP